MPLRLDNKFSVYRKECLYDTQLFEQVTGKSVFTVGPKIVGPP